jgi:hypothetical protein
MNLTETKLSSQQSVSDTLLKQHSRKKAINFENLHSVFL